MKNPSILLKNLNAAALACLLGHGAASANPRTSADYAITTEIVDATGQRTASVGGLYANNGSTGQIVGISSQADESARHGYIGQLYELLGYGLLASDYYPAELGTTQLFPVRSADDGTNVVVPTTGITFSVLSGPLASISPTGLVTAGAVYQNTPAMVGATSAAFAGQLTLPLYVQDAIPDNFGSYAGDGLDDAWQFQYFGLNNPLAAPGVDADGSGLTNLFKYTAGLDPLDPNSRFVLEIQNGLLATERRLVFHPRMPDRSYTIEFRASLSSGQWDPLGGTSFADQADIRTVTDHNAATPSRVYRVRITKP